ncbi:MAG: TonB-dependent receptor plug domain-containing protein [Gammaproteobacteria bacterium]
MKLFRITYLVIFLPLILGSFRSPAQNLSDEEALLQVYGDEELITIATGKKQPASKAPAVTTVITAEDIKAIGATDIDEILETVPGLHVARSAIGYDPIYTIRGVFSDFNPQVLVLINGIPITNLFQGNRNAVWGGMPVDAIQRIEVIRGPGSAVYGADAFAGVINIVTKTSEDLSGTEIGGRYGSFDTWDGWLLHGGTYKGFEVAAMLEYHDTDGQRENIEADAQTLFDNIFGSNASLAPGPVNVQRENIDARLDIHRENWRLRAGLQRRQDFGTGAGVAQALDPDGRFDSDRWNVDLTYHNPLLTEQWDVEAQISYFDTSQEVDRNVLLFPRGTVLPIGPDGNISGTGIPALFPNGFIGNPEVFERHARAHVSAFYTGFDRHLLRMGVGFNYANIWKVKESKNFGIDPSTETRIEPPGSRLAETTDTPFVFLNEGDRKNYYFFLQDSWHFANDWELTGGLRYDNFSDFGNTINPRFALVWQTRQNLTSKLLYGEAFRAPSFAETSNINNPVALGNPNLKPEKIRTAELAFDYLPTEGLRLSSNVYRYWWSDFIRFVPDPGATSSTAQNTGEQTGYGLEIEADWHVTPYFSLLGNYAFQTSEDDTSNEDAGNAPHHQVYVRADWEFLPHWHFHPQVNWIVDRDRVAGDNRPEIDDYSTVDLTLRRIGIHNHWDLAYAVRNLFDSDVREPSLTGIPAASIPNDLPQAGRSFYGEVRFRF